MVEYDNKKMTLIIKPTEACNFSCTFCSSSELVEDKTSRLPLEQIYQFLKRFPETQVIFVVGGDPLMMKPQYYWDLIAHLDEHDYKCKISLTTNLWDFYKKPEKWVDLFKHPRIEVGTSFQYGDGRQIKPGEVLTETKFIEIYRKYKELVGHDIAFLAVIDKSNESKAIDHLRLAKYLGTECRLVYSNASGRQTKPYPLSRMYKIYKQIWEEGLADYEQTIATISEKISGVEVSCPLSRNCDSRMRSLNPDGRYFTCGPLNDDLDPVSEVDFEAEMAGGFETPLQHAPDLQYLKEECFTCPMFQVCNGCRKHIKDLKNHNMVEEHCDGMKEIMDDLIEISKSSEMTQFRNLLEEHRTPLTID